MAHLPSRTAALLLALAVPAAGSAAARPNGRAAAYQRWFEALELVSAGRNAEARHKLDEILEIDPGAAEVHAMLARLCLKDGDVMCAESRASHAVELAPDLAEGHRVLAEIDLQQLQRSGETAALERALVHLAAAARAAPHDVTTWNAWIRTLATNGRDDEARDVAARASATPGVDPSVPWMTLARIFLGRGQAERAIAVLDAVEVQGRGAVPILETLADLKAGRGDLRGQAAALERLRQFRPDDADLAHRLGAVLLELGDFYGAERPLRDAFEARAGDPLVRRDLARALVRLGRGAAALDLLRELPQVYRAPHTLLLWAQAAEQAARFAEAADRLDELSTALGEDDRKAFGGSLRLRSARDRLRARQPDRALALCEGQDRDPSLLRVRLQALDLSGRGMEAESVLRLRRAAEPHDAALLALAAERVAQRSGRDLAVQSVVAALHEVPAVRRAGLAVDAAEWLTAWDQPELAAALLDAENAADVVDVPVLRGRAGTFSAVGRAAEAEALYRKALAAAPDDDGLMNDLGFLLANEGRSIPEAVTLLERAVKLRPDQTAYLDSLGWALHRAGRTGEALPLLRRAAQKAREREEPTIREHLGDVYLALGDEDRARAEWEAALALGSGQRPRLLQKIERLATERTAR